eukprot:scaffold36942_cov50-Phaeocystis_antarctica.AAC.6
MWQSTGPRDSAPAPPLPSVLSDCVPLLASPCVRPLQSRWSSPWTTTLNPRAPGQQTAAEAQASMHLGECRLPRHAARCFR